MAAWQGVLARIEKRRVGVEYAQHPGNRAVVDRVIRVDRDRVFALYDRENLRETLDGVLEIRSSGSRRADGRTVKVSEDRRKHQYTKNQKSPAPLGFHATLAFSERLYHGFACDI